MGKVVRCAECAKVYRDAAELEELRDNDSICIVCNAPIEVSDWDRILASWEDEEEDLDDIDDDVDDDWSGAEDDVGFDDDFDGEEPGDDDLHGDDADLDDDLDDEDR